MKERKKRVAVISFTTQGSKINRRLTEALKEQGYSCFGYEKGGHGADERLITVKKSVVQWAGERFQDSEAIIFVGAVGIAVRAVAPWLRDKWTDPAVVAADEAGQFVVSLLSGHVGGANDLTVAAAEILKAVPIVTTATDVNRCFAVDVFAAKNGLYLMDRNLAKEISGQILEGRQAGLFSDYPIDGICPKELACRKDCGRNIWITRSRKQLCEGGEKVLKLVPRIIHIGIGCRKGISGYQIAEAVMVLLESHDCLLESIAAVASINIKKDEPGIRWLAEQLQVPFHVYSPKDLAEVRGEFEESSFVAQVTGIGNVCERAALLDLVQEGKTGRIICKKQVVSGVTVALAEETWKGSFSLVF